ncbi:hypothetical protein CP532_4564 [Ophiocordyceps camponoti-leonardi (nom. inval.)]|nr:hypothetical protein CP532_4564 [Ophiocordyceps camponoti-leonardi (nom. inval.)]
MTELRESAHASTRLVTSDSSPTGPTTGIQATSVRSRNCRAVKSDETAVNRGMRSIGRSADSTPTDRAGGISSSRQRLGTSTIGQFFGDSWSQSWNSVQELAATFLSAGEDARQLRLPLPGYRESRDRDLTTESFTAQSRTAVRTATILESHEGVNGGLDITGRYKRRSSDESAWATPQTEDCLVYIHHIQSEDTYAGLILRYRCREDVFRRANGLWSGDNIQTRKWLVLPVDACDVRGRPCDTPPPQTSSESGILASASRKLRPRQARHPDSLTTITSDHMDNDSAQGDEYPWTHVRWVYIESCLRSVQIGRVTKETLGYFPPRRKRSTKTTSSLSTPRQSSELSSTSAETAGRSLSHRHNEPGGPWESSRIVEAPPGDDHDTAYFSRQSNSLDKAAAAVESWLRVALAKRPNTPVIGSLARQTGWSTIQRDSDLIELTDTAHDQNSSNNV